MDRQRALDTLRRAEIALRERGIVHAALFGSVARGENRPGSDLDVMIEIAPDADLGVYDYVALKDFVAGLFDTRVDVVNRESLKSHVSATAAADMLYAF